MDSARIWLIGVAVAENAQIEQHLFWAVTDDQQRDALIKLGRLLEQNAGLPVVTWAGDSADIPVLRAASAAAGLTGLLDHVLAGHVDLYQHALRSRRWPIPELGLKQLSQFLGITRTSSVHDGRHAQALYHQMRTSQEPAERERLKGLLEDYSRDDLTSLIAIARKLVGYHDDTSQRTSRPSSQSDDGLLPHDFIEHLVGRIDKRLDELNLNERLLRSARARLTGPPGP